MIATADLSPVLPAGLREYVVGHGKSGGLGRYAPTEDLVCRRGDRVIIESRRGVELGVVLCEATPLHARLLPTSAAGLLRRLATAADEETEQRLQALGRELFEAARCSAESMPLDIVDVDMLHDGREAVLQYLAWEPVDTGPFAEELGRRYGLTILLEDLAGQPEPPDDHHGCDKPDCGRGAGGGCTSCGTGGGCSSCGSGKVDMSAYFAHLRTKMEEHHQRQPLL